MLMTRHYLIKKILVPSSTSLGIGNINQQAKNGSMLQRDSNLSDDEPLYDAVASDDDYATLMPVTKKPSSQLVGQQQQVSVVMVWIVYFVLF